MTATISGLRLIDAPADYNAADHSGWILNEVVLDFDRGFNSGGTTDTTVVLKNSTPIGNTNMIYMSSGADLYQGRYGMTRPFDVPIDMSSPDVFASMHFKYTGTATRTGGEANPQRFYLYSNSEKTEYCYWNVCWTGHYIDETKALQAVTFTRDPDFQTANFDMRNVYGIGYSLVLVYFTTVNYDVNSIMAGSRYNSFTRWYIGGFCLVDGRTEFAVDGVTVSDYVALIDRTSSSPESIGNALFSISETSLEAPCKIKISSDVFNDKVTAINFASKANTNLNTDVIDGQTGLILSGNGSLSSALCATVDTRHSVEITDTFKLSKFTTGNVSTFHVYGGTIDSLSVDDCLNFVWSGGTIVKSKLNNVLSGLVINRPAGDYSANTIELTNNPLYDVQINQSGTFNLSGLSFGETAKIHNNSPDAVHVILDTQAEIIATTSGGAITYEFPVEVSQATTTGILPNSRLQIFNETKQLEVLNEIVTSDWSFEYADDAKFSGGDVIRVRVTYANGTVYKLPFETRAIVGAGGFSVLIDQQDWTVLNSFAIDGFACDYTHNSATGGEYVSDYTNIQIILNDTDGKTTKTRLVAWYAWLLWHHPVAINAFFGGLTLEDEANIRVNSDKVNLKLENAGATPIQFTDVNIRLYCSDGSSPLAQTGNSIFMDSGKVYTNQVYTGGSALTPTESAHLLSLSNSSTVDLSPVINAVDNIEIPQPPQPAEIADAVWRYTR